MPTSTTLVETHFSRLVNKETKYYSRSDPTEGWTDPAKQSGSFITLPGGYKFRSATQRNLNKRWMEPGNGFNTSGMLWDTRDKKWVPCQIVSGPGGYGYNRVGTSAFYSCFSMPDVGMVNMGQNVFVPSDARNEAVVKALNDIADGKANLGENLGTLGMTLRMLHSPVKALAGGLRSVYNNRSLRPFIRESLHSLKKKGPLNAAAEKYLEYVYGWKPLMQDIHGLVEYAKERGEKPLLLSGYGKAQRESQPVPKESASGIVTTAITGGNATSKVRCKLYARLDPNARNLRTLNQLGLLNPLALAWELATFSFVVDWILPIGPVLNALTAPIGLIFVDGSISNRVSVTANWENWNNEYESKIPASRGTGKFRYEGYSRDRITAWPKVGFWFDQDPFRGDRILKATALMITNLRGLR